MPTALGGKALPASRDKGESAIGRSLSSSQRSAPTTVTIVLASQGRRLLTEALSRAIRADRGVPATLVCEPVHDGEAVVESCRRARPDVLLIDVDGGSPSRTVQVVHDVKDASPSTRVVLVLGSRWDKDALLMDFIEAGVDAFLDRVGGVEDLMEGIMAAARGAVLVPETDVVSIVRNAARERDEQRRATSMLGSLTEREHEILLLILEGLRNDEIAAKLHISARTVGTHVQNLYRKIDVHSRLQAVAFANRLDLFAPQGVAT